MKNNIPNTISINSSPLQVWNILTNPDLMKYWLYETPFEIISNWKVGDPIVFKGDLHGIKFEKRGIILELETEKVFKYSYKSNISEGAHDCEYDAVLEFIISEENKNKTMLTVTCSEIATEAIYGHLDFYWASTILMLKELAEKKINN